MIWLGPKRGYLSDWLTQQWVRVTGRLVRLRENPWLDGPIGRTTQIGLRFFHDLASEKGYVIKEHEKCGLLHCFGDLKSSSFDPSNIHPAVIHFYENTSEYEMDAWAQWCGFFRPFGWLLARLFSRRLQQLNVPLSGLDTSHGISSRVVQLQNPTTSEVAMTAWVRELIGSKNVLYAGSYSICCPPKASGPCVKVVFPLPNGNAIVVMRPKANEDGSFSVISDGTGFGDAGFYFTVRSGGDLKVRYVNSLKEEIRVYAAQAEVRADHFLWLVGAKFLQLHYRLRRKF